MATRLILKSEYQYGDMLEDSKSEDIVVVEGYVEGESDTIVWRFEQFSKLLLAEGYSIGLIKKYLNYQDGEVFELDDVD